MHLQKGRESMSDTTKVYVADGENMGIRGFTDEASATLVHQCFGKERLSHEQEDALQFDHDDWEYERYQSETTSNWRQEEQENNRVSGIERIMKTRPGVYRSRPQGTRADLHQF